MVGSLAYAVALVAHGNLFLAGGGDPPQLVDSNKTFQYVGEIRFVHPKPQGGIRAWFRRESAHADSNATVNTNTGEWFRHLKDAGVTKLSLANAEQRTSDMPVHVAVAFAGTTPWVIYAEGTDASLCWRGRDELIDPPDLRRIARGDFKAAPKKARGNRIWRVVYTGTFDEAKRGISSDVPGARQTLDTMLQRAVDFTIRAKLDFWRANFETARAQLSADAPQVRYYLEVLPARGYGLAARQLLAAASGAWVFGGMGSWNDLMFDRALQDEYQAITPDLYSAVVNGVIAAANAFARDGEN